MRVDPPGLVASRLEAAYDPDQGVELTAVGCPGYSFVRWEVCAEDDGDLDSGPGAPPLRNGDGGGGGEGRGETCKSFRQRRILVLMGSDKKAWAVYRRRRSGPRLPPGEVGRTARALIDFPSGWSTSPAPEWGVLMDLLPPPGGGGPLLVVGGPGRTGDFWEGLSTWPPGGFRLSRLGVEEGYSLSLGGAEYAPGPGVSYCLVAAIYPPGCGACWPEIHLTGLTPEGTRAGLLWLMENSRGIYPGAFVLLEWRDSNGDGEVQVGEVSVAAAGGVVAP